jgi:pimeloyl-ACP methyl ester carboxylesterase
MVLPSLRIFSPRSATILALAKESDLNARIVSVYGRFDPHIPEGSELNGAAKNVRLDNGGHFRVLADPRVVGELIALSESGATR